MRIEHLVVAGFWTSGVILSTVREAFDKDYQLTVIDDCCSEPEIATHDFLMKKIFPSQAKVTNTENWITSIN